MMGMVALETEMSGAKLRSTCLTIMFTESLLRIIEGGVLKRTAYLTNGWHLKAVWAAILKKIRNHKCQNTKTLQLYDRT